jgi:16S rRNA (guanine966-N2)-methyltransferase
VRLSGGDLRSRRIHVPRGSAIRPTPGRVREALFSILGAKVDGARFLDLYAGTGAIGFEALSRGATHATFVEAHRPTALRIRALGEQLGVAERVTVIAAPAERAAAALAGPYDIVYADPPYADAAPVELFARLRERDALAADATIVYEHRSRVSLAATGLHAARSQRYGEVTLEFLAFDA